VIAAHRQPLYKHTLAAHDLAQCRGRGLLGGRQCLRRSGLLVRQLRRGQSRMVGARAQRAFRLRACPAGGDRRRCGQARAVHVIALPLSTTHAPIGVRRVCLAGSPTPRKRSMDVDSHLPADMGAAEVMSLLSSQLRPGRAAIANLSTSGERGYETIPNEQRAVGAFP
jgi:hypothetical protein